MTAPARRKLQLRPAKPRSETLSVSNPWRILVVDDDPQVHAMTDLLFQDYRFDHRPFQAIHAYSAAAAMERLEQDPLIPVALVDVVMERPDAGLELIRTIRNQLDNPTIRIILRTGQPGEAPERDVVLDYDVNDYKAKTELTSQKLFTALVGALRSWRDIMHAAQMADQLAEANTNLERRVQDRTRELTQALEQASIARRDLRQFLSMMSHEFRTPLAIIDSAAQMLLMQNNDRREASVPRLTAIRGGVDRLVTLIDTCLADDRLDAETIVLHAALLDLAPLVQAAIEQQRQAHPGQEITLILPPLPHLLIDFGLMSIALNSLLNNAIKYSSAPVEMRLTSLPGHVQIAVTDHGLGIPTRDLDNIFDRFYRSDNVKGMAGTGIGLSLSLRIVQLHGGTLTVTSTENVGSTFTVTLPVPAAAATS